MSQSQHFDAIVIGAGSGGVRAARTAAALGARVAIIESRFYGGTCVNVGCVPKKLFAYASHVRDELALAADYGFQVQEQGFDWARLRDAKTKEINRLNGIYQKLLEGAGVSIFEGLGQVVAPGQVKVGTQLLEAPRILVATGGRPFVPDLPGNEHLSISDDLFFLPSLPRRALVLGGGYIATEFASILLGLGVEVTLVYRGTQILRGFDDDLRAFVSDRLVRRGLHLRLETDVAAIERNGDGYRVRFGGADSEETDLVLAATGRVANLEGLFPGPLQPQQDERGFLKVDEHFQTSVPGLYALGDVIGRVQLTPVALAEGMYWARHCFAGATDPHFSYDNIPTAVFTQPQMATVGLTEAQARERGWPVKVFRSDFRPLRYTLGQQDQRTLMKLVVHEETDQVLGMHMAGDDAAEIIQGFAVAVVMGARKADLDCTLGIHPTAGEEFVTLRG